MSVMSVAYYGLDSWRFVVSSFQKILRGSQLTWYIDYEWVAVISAKNHKRQRRKRQSVTAK